MTQEEIKKAFEGRWAFKPHVFSAEEHIQGEIKRLCFDFFQAGILLEKNQDSQSIESVDDGSSVVTVTTDFDVWWKLYDKKIDRAKCLKKWEKLTQKEKVACIAATPAYVASTPDLKYRRNPMTYLNNKSWENQIIPCNNGTDKPTIQQQRFEKFADILAG